MALKRCCIFFAGSGQGADQFMLPIYKGAEELNSGSTVKEPSGQSGAWTCDLRILSPAAYTILLLRRRIVIKNLNLLGTKWTIIYVKRVSV